MKKVCLITCYNQPDYIRAKTLRVAFGGIDDVNLIVVKNKHTGLFRYIEVIWKLIVVRATKRPDLYFLTFRGYEMLPFVRLLTIGKPLVFDEFINLVEWVVHEHSKLKKNGILARILLNNYRFWLKTVDLIVTDTPSHADYSSRLMGVPIDKYVPLIVSTDEQIFGGNNKLFKRQNKSFKLFYYGNMLPLHGLEVVIEAMRLLKAQNIDLDLIGGKNSVKKMVEQARHDGLNINYKTWVLFNKLPKYMQQADVCLGGPFGGTVQSQFVITGKTYQFLQMGRPVIIGENLESGLFADKKDALIVKQASPLALSEAILWASQHPVQLNKIGQAGKKLYQKEFSNQCLIKQLRLLLGNKHIL